MKMDDSKKTTALGVVVFSMLMILVYIAVSFAVGIIISLAVYKGDYSENMMRVGSVIMSSIAMLAASFFMRYVTNIKGIYSAVLTILLVLLLKIVGKCAIDSNTLFGIGTMIGVVSTVVFGFVGTMLSDFIKR